MRRERRRIREVRLKRMLLGFWLFWGDRGDNGYGSVRTLWSGLWCKKDDIFTLSLFPFSVFVNGTNENFGAGKFKCCKRSKKGSFNKNWMINRLIDLSNEGNEIGRIYWDGEEGRKGWFPVPTWTGWFVFSCFYRQPLILSWAGLILMQIKKVFFFSPRFCNWSATWEKVSLRLCLDRCIWVSIHPKFPMQYESNYTYQLIDFLDFVPKGLAWGGNSKPQTPPTHCNT